MHLHCGVSDMSIARILWRLVPPTIAGGLVLGGLAWSVMSPQQGLITLAFLSALVVGLAQQTIP